MNWFELRRIRIEKSGKQERKRDTIKEYRQEKHHQTYDMSPKSSPEQETESLLWKCSFLQLNLI